MLCPSSIYAQLLSESKQDFLKSLPEYQWMQKELESKWSQLILLESAGPQEVDVQQYTLEIEFSPATYYISGEVTIEAETLSLALDTLSIDCHSTLTVDSLSFDGSPKSYTHADDKITLSFDPPPSRLAGIYGEHHLPRHLYSQSGSWPHICGTW
jgi:hypothetical protein